MRAFAGSSRLRVDNRVRSHSRAMVIVGGQRNDGAMLAYVAERLAVGQQPVCLAECRDGD